MEEERAQLRKEKEKYNSMDEFVKYSKIERQIMKLDKEISNLKPEFSLNTLNNNADNINGLYKSVVNLIFQNMTYSQILSAIVTFTYSVILY